MITENFIFVRTFPPKFQILVLLIEYAICIMQYLVLLTRNVLKVLVCVNHERLRPHLLGELRLPPNMLQPAMSVFQ